MFICVPFLFFALSAQAQYDILIRNGMVVDGSGNPWQKTSIAIRGDSIAAVGPLDGATAHRTIDAAGRVVAPGFIDIHNHGRRGIFEAPTAENYIRQGVTSLIEGPDGGSPIPLRPWFQKLEAKGISVNMGAFIGQGSVRREVLGLENRAATPAEIERMKALVRRGMEDGALGMSTGLFYVPGNYTPTAEVIELAKVAGRMSGIHISHMRNEADGVLDSVRETIEIGEKGGLPTQVTHHKIIGTPNWGRSEETIRLVEEARARGVDVTIDQYPYTASSTGLTALVPQWAQEGGDSAMRERFQDAAARSRIKAAIVKNIREDRGGGDPRNIQFANCSFDSTLAGKTLADATRTAGREPTPENAAETAMELLSRGSCQTIYHAIHEKDVERVMQYPWTMVASDGEVAVFGRGVIHPRSYGTFARVLGLYVREKRLLRLEDAVRKMSSLPAHRLGLYDRGLLRPGIKADVVIFDPATVADKAEFGKPHQYAIGFSHVIVNGQFVIDDGRVTEHSPGRVLYGPAYRQN